MSRTATVAVNAKVTTKSRSHDDEPVPVGRGLDQLWNVGAKHALNHREGCWYNNLRYFPAALFDPDGYVRFESEDSYRTCRYLPVTKETDVRSGISSIPGYVRMTMVPTIA